MPINAQHPGDLARNLFFQFEQRRRKLVEFGKTFRAQGRGSRVKEDLGLEHEAVADHADFGAVAEDRIQAPEEFRAVTREFLHALRQRDIQALAEFGNARLRLLVAFLRNVQRLLQGRELTPQCGDLLIEELDLRERAHRDALFAL